MFVHVLHGHNTVHGHTKASSLEMRLPTETNEMKSMVLSEELIKIKQNMVMGHELQ